MSDNGLVAVLQDPLSSFLWKVTPDSLEVKLIEAVVEETLPEGAAVIVVFGVTESNVIVSETADVSFPAVSLKITETVREPCVLLSVHDLLPE